HERIRTTVLFAPPASAPGAFPSEPGLGAQNRGSALPSTRGRPLQRALDAYYGEADSIGEILSTGIVLIGQLTDAAEAIAAERSAGIASGQRCAVRPAALDGELPPSSPVALFGVEVVRIFRVVRSIQRLGAETP